MDPGQSAKRQGQGESSLGGCGMPRLLEMGLREQIFPPGPPADGNIVRTELVGTWESQLLGIGRLTRFLTDRLLSESFGVDDMALYMETGARSSTSLRPTSTRWRCRKITFFSRFPVPTTSSADASRRFRR